MSGSLEVREFLMRYDEDSGRPAAGGVPAQRVSGSDTSRITDDQVRRARVAVASGSEDPQDCERLLDMLGLIPAEDGVPPVQR